MALSGSSSPHFYLARSRSTSLPPLSSTKERASASASSSSWPFQALPCLGLAFDDPSFFADLRVDINPIPSRDTSRQKETEKKSEPSTSTTTNTGEDKDKDKDKLADDSAGPPNPPDHHYQPDPPATREGNSSSDDCVWVHRMVLAVHSPVFRSLLRPGGSRESRESAIDMRGPQHPPGVVVRCMLKMMYSSPGLAIDELDKETKLSEEWEFLLQLFKLAHLYQVEVALDACTRRLKHILERKSDHCAQRQHRQRSPREDEDKSGGGGWGSEEDDERTKQTCYALELLAFLLHVREAESLRDGGELNSVDVLASGSGGGAKSVSADELGGKKDRKGSTRRGEDSSDDVSVREGAVNVSKKECSRVAVMEEEQAMMTATVNVGERREDLLVRMLDGHLYPQLPMIVQHIRCEDVLTLQHLLRLSVCRPSPSSPPCVASLTHSWSGVRTSHVRPYNA